MMTAKKTKPMTDKERQIASLARFKKEGGKCFSVKLSKRAVTVLESLKKDFATQNEAIEYAILQHEQRSLI